MGEDNFDPALVYDVRRGLEGAAQTLADEVQRSIEHHRSQEAAREVSSVLISGEAALIPNLDGYLGELLDVPTSRGNPVEKLSANRSNVSDDQLRAMEPVLAVAFGLAMEEE
jgi:type IV pilus assembly protein PilM